MMRFGSSFGSMKCVLRVSGQQRHLDLRRCRKYCGHHENCGHKYQYDSAAIPSTAQRATQRANVAGVQRAWGVGRRDRATSRVERECVALLEGAAARGKASKVAQAQMAEKLGITQANVSRIESWSDMMLSTLGSYARAVDAEVEILVRIRHDVFQLRFEESRGLKHGLKVVANMGPNS